MQQLFLQPDHIVDVFVLIDEIAHEAVKAKGGRPKHLTDAELITLLVWNCLSHTNQRTLKDIFFWALNYHQRDFPGLRTYGAFVSHCHRVIPGLLDVLSHLLVPAEIQFMDSTKLPVCRNHRANSYKVAPGLTGWGRNWQGYWFGFKLHLAIDAQGRISGLTFTPADRYDGQLASKLVGPETKVVVGDSHYGASTTRTKLWRDHGVVVVAPVHYKQDKKLQAEWQRILLELRAKVECTFDQLKEHLPLVSSFPRSANGYLLHYTRIILGYQLGVLGF